VDSLAELSLQKHYMGFWLITIDYVVSEVNYWRTKMLLHTNFNF